MKLLLLLRKALMKRRDVGEQDDDGWNSHKDRHHNKRSRLPTRRGTARHGAARRAATSQTASPWFSVFSSFGACSRPHSVSSSYGFCSRPAGVRARSSGGGGGRRRGNKSKQTGFLLVDEDAPFNLRGWWGLRRQAPEAVRMRTAACTYKCLSQEGSINTEQTIKEFNAIRAIRQTYITKVLSYFFRKKI